MKFSIVTPSYNQGQFIEQTIKSVLDQEGDFYIDYIIADGGSTDDSVEVIKKYDDLLKRGLYPIKCRGIEFRWWSRKDNGQSDAINQGFRLAEGEILAWINSDDFYEPDAFKEVSEIFSTHQELELVYGDGYVFKDGTPTKTIKTSTVGTFNEFLRRYNYIFQPSAFFKKSLLDKTGLLDENLNFVMDYDLWLRILKLDAHNTLHTSATWSNYREWALSKSVSQMNELLEERKKIFKKYGGNRIDPYRIQHIINSRYFKFIRKANLYTANKLEKCIYFISDSFHY